MSVIFENTKYYYSAWYYVPSFYWEITVLCDAIVRALRNHKPKWYVFVRYKNTQFNSSIFYAQNFRNFRFPKSVEVEKKSRKIERTQRTLDAKLCIWITFVFLYLLGPNDLKQWWQINDKMAKLFMCKFWIWYIIN